jgi:hypothetical protein
MQLFGYNNLSIPDKGLYKVHIRKLKPAASLFYNNELDFAREIKAEFPAMAVIYRNWPDQDVHKKWTPAQWLDHRADEARGNLMLYTTNESGCDQAIIDWHLELMEQCIPLHIPLCLLNLGTGLWDDVDMPRLRPLLKLAGEHRDLFVLGLHEYAGTIITSGIRGGWPNNAGVEPGKPGGTDLTVVDNWKQVKPTDTFFHIGRHKIVLDYCDAEHIPAPRIGLTEVGFDYTGDIAGWIDPIARQTGFSSVNGWHTLTGYWREIFPDWTPERAYIEQFKWAAPILLRGVDFALFYCYGEDGNWPNYRVDNSAIPALLEATVAATEEHPIVQPDPPPVPPKVPQVDELPVITPIPVELPVRYKLTFVTEVMFPPSAMKWFQAAGFLVEPIVEESKP